MLRKLGIVAGCGVIALLLIVLALRPSSAAGPCNVINGPATLPDLPEASGLALSRRSPGVIWSHNDSGNFAVLFALDSSGQVLGRVRAPVNLRDWEDISIGHCSPGDCLYLAAIGDNKAARREIQIYRVPEPKPGDTETGPAELFTATYDDGPHNAEAMFVIGADMFVITRDRTGRVYRSLPAFPGRSEISLERVGQLGLEVVSDAEATPDEKSVVVRNSDEAVFYWTADLLHGELKPYLRIPIDGLREHQGEGVAVDAKGMLYLASEGIGLWRGAGRLVSLSCKLPEGPL